MLNQALDSPSCLCKSKQEHIQKGSFFVLNMLYRVLILVGHTICLCFDDDNHDDNHEEEIKKKKQDECNDIGMETS